MNLNRYAIIFSLLFSALPLSALDGSSAPSVPPQDLNPYLDPGFHDFAETTQGYLNPKYSPGSANDLRDSPTSLFPAASAKGRGGLPAGPKPGEQALKNFQAPPVKPQPAASAGAAQAPKSAPGRQYKVTFAGEGGPLSSFVSPPGSGAASGFKIGDYTFISILPRTDDNASLMSALAAEGFKFAGEKTVFTAEGKKTFLLGWASYSRLERISRNPLVQRAALETTPSGKPFRVRVRFTLRAPGGGNSAVFVDDFLRSLGSSAGFSMENVSRLPGSPGSSKFTAFEILGSLPVDMLRSISLSPFVAAMELQDQAL